MNDRIPWARYFMNIAEQVARRGTCDRKQVGCVITVGNVMVSSGYNGAPSKLPHCDEEGVGHELVQFGDRISCVRSVHAEANAIIQAARHGLAIGGGICYTTTLPCYDCAKQIINAGIVKVVYGDSYQSRLSERTLELFAMAGIKLLCVTEVT